MNTKIPFRTNRLLHLMILVYVGIWIWMAVEPYSRFDWFLENLLIWVTLLLLIGTYYRFAFSNLSYGLIALFLLLHTVGAHYSYNENAVDVWLKFIFHSERNNYDRLVHFSFGLLLAYPIREVMRAWTDLGNKWLYGMTCTIVLAFGAFYELIEMWVAMIVAPEIGTMFLGTQGDPWDSQHDMELALYGAVIAMIVTVICRRRRG
jgi:putative membrane protein